MASTWVDRLRRRFGYRPGTERLYLQALLAQGVPSGEAADWYRLGHQAKPFPISPQHVAEYWKVGFTPATAGSWVAFVGVSPAPNHAFRLHQKGWTGFDYSLMRNRFPAAWAHRAFTDDTTTVSDTASAMLLAWLRSDLPGWVAIQYILSGIDLSEALETFEPVRAENHGEWKESVEFLAAFHNMS